MLDHKIPRSYPEGGYNRIDGDKKSTNPRRNFSLIVASIRHPWSTRWHEIHESPSCPVGSIRIQLSSFRNNCYRFPTAMLHFQVFTSARSPPSLLHPRFVPPFRPFHSPYPFAPPSLNRLSLSLLCWPLFLSSGSPYPPTYLLSFSALFQTRHNVSLAIARPRPAFSRRACTQTLSRASIYEYTVNVPPRSPLSRSSSSPEDLFVLRGLRISSRHNGRLTDTRLCLSLLDGMRKRDKGRDRKGKRRERGRKRVARSRVYGHTSEIAKVEESAFLVPLASTGNMAAPVAQLEQACARARRLQYH